MPRPYFAPAGALPARPNLVQLRKQAKELSRAYLARDPAAIAFVERFDRKPDPPGFGLADAQRILARSYGFPSWTKLKQHVDGVNIEAFCAAAEAGDAAIVRRLARARPELVNMPRGGRFGETMALHMAVLNRDAEMTRALMELGSDARAGIWPHREATSASVIARERGYDEIVEIIEREEERRRRQLSCPGATVNALIDEIEKAVREGRHDDVARILDSDLSLAGACNVRGQTPLHVAASVHDPQMVAWLLDRGASVDARDVDGRTPLDCAAIFAGWSANDRFFPFLENAQVDPARFHETVPLLRSYGAELTPRAAVAVGDAQAVRQMHCEGRLANEIHLHRGGLLAVAVRVNRPDLVSLLLDLALDPTESVIADDGATSRGMPLWFAALCGRHEIAELLLARGADVNAIVYACGDALSVADSTGDERMKSLLLANGARVTVERVAGGRDRSTAQAILDGKLPGHSLNVDDPSPTDLAEQMLWAAGGSDPEIVRMCLPCMRKNRDDPWWNYVLMHATLPESFRLVLQHGVDPDVAGEGGFGMLHHLATSHVDEQHRLTRATMLLDAGASLTKRDALLKSTPLGWACRWGRVELVKLYLERGADARERDAEPWATPLAWAEKGNHREIVELLGAGGAET